jgi:molybdopterin-guanine dinucleotide biosynthesis protein A
MNSPASSKNASITAAVLAGGQGRRFGGLDKGIQPLFGRPVVSFVVDALRPHCETIVICANRHHDEYARFAKVLPDDFQGFRGPLAGISTALTHCKTRWLLTVPVDTPKPPGDLIARLLTGTNAAQAAVADDGARRQPLFALYDSELAASARNALEHDLAVWRWQEEIGATVVDFSDMLESFNNLNTLGDFRRWESDHRE